MSKTARWKALSAWEAEYRRRSQESYEAFLSLRPDQRDYATHIGRSQKSPPLYKVIEKTLRNRP
jgi:hypothetical protein